MHLQRISWQLPFGFIKQTIFAQFSFDFYLFVFVLLHVNDLYLLQLFLLLLFLLLCMCGKVGKLIIGRKN